MTLAAGAMATTIMITAPHPVQAIAVPLLRRYAADTLVRVPAHFTVLFPFVPLERLDSASQTVREICASIAPFDITLSGYDSFPGVAFMTALDPEPIQAVFRRIYAAFPECPPYEGAYGNDLHPHMTVGEFASEAEQEAAILPHYEPISFRVDRLHVMYGLHKVALPWITHSVIRLSNQR
jgi:2'-5' RNA ligase